VQGYKGVDDLLAAFAGLPDDLDAQLTVAGECSDPVLRSALAELALRSPGRVFLRLARIPDDAVTPLFEEADVVVLPFREITTSGSAVLALCHGRPLIVPDRASVADLPDDAVIQYDGTVPGLTAVLADVVRADGAVLAKLSAAALAYRATLSWSEIAATTIDRMSQVIADPPRPARGR
jgi:glycosyltransferase involved in cell wall biosynthesis